MKRVLLINAGGAGNLGDEAVKCALEKLLKDAGCDVDWASFSGHRKAKGAIAVRPRQVSADPWRRLVKRVVPVEFRWLLRSWTTFLRYLGENEYDLVLIGGGQLIQSNGIFGLAMFIWVYLFKKLHKKKIILIGVGATERYTAFDKYLYSKSLKSVDAIYVRDRDSLCVLKNVFGIESKLVPDIAFYISKIYNYPTRKERRAMFCPTSYEFYQSKRDNPDIGPDENEYLQYWEDRMVEYFKDDYDVKLFCTSRQQDLPIAESLKQILYDKHSIDVELLDISVLEELTKEIAKSKVVVAGRMHALIIGYIYGCKITPFKTSEKIGTFENEYLHSNVCIEDVQSSIVSTIEEIVNFT